MSEARLGALLKAAVDGIVGIDERGIIRTMNPSAERMFGFTPGEAVGQNVKMFMPPPYHEEHDGYLGRYLVTGEKRIIGIGREVVGRRKDGTTFPMDLSVAEAHVGGERIFVGILRNITERKRLEQELRTSEARLREQASVFEHAQVLVRDLEDRITHWSEGAARLYGWSREEALGQVSHSLLQTIFSTPLDAIRAELDRRGGWEGELIHHRKGGDSVVVAAHWVVHRDEKGTPRAILEVNNDITSRQRADEARAFIAALVESSDDAIVGKSLEGTITSWNAGAERIFGYSAQEAVGRHISILAPADRAGEVTAILDRIRKGEHITHFETVRVRKNGEHLDVSVTVSPIKDGAGKVLGASTIKRDITDQKLRNEEIRAMTQQLWHAAKLASVGELAASIAHELNNPLATVHLRIESVLARTPSDDPRRRALEIVEQEAKRMGGLVANLLQFSRHGSEQISTIDVGEELTKAVELVHHLLRKRSISVSQVFDPTTPTLHADRQKLRQVFLNLLTNASDAMHDGGTLTLRTSPDTLDDGKPGVRIEFLDTGAGIRAENLEKIMEPFFTTKEEGKGTGLGLAICRRIVQEHDGTLRITSDEGKGTHVCVVLPIRNSTNATRFHDVGSIGLEATKGMKNG